MATTQQITVQTAPEKVFTYLADLTRHGEWGKEGHKLEIEKTSEGPVGKGSTFRSVGHQFGRNEDTVTITEHVPNERIVYECEGNAGRIRHWFEISTGDGGVELTKGFEAVQAKFPFALFLPIASMFTLPGALKGDLERIKARLEGS